MRYLLDTNACIELLDGHRHLVQRASMCDEGDLAMSAIAFAEVALGSWRGKRPSLLLLTNLSRSISIEPFDEAAARQYAQLTFRRGSFDRLIAAHALALQLTLVTNNSRDLEDIPNLRIEDWTAPL